MLLAMAMGWGKLCASSSGSVPVSQSKAMGLRYSFISSHFQFLFFHSSPFALARHGPLPRSRPPPPTDSSSSDSDPDFDANFFDDSDDIPMPIFTSSDDDGDK